MKLNKSNSNITSLSFNKLKFEPWIAEEDNRNIYNRMLCTKNKLIIKNNTTKKINIWNNNLKNQTNNFIYKKKHKINKTKNYYIKIKYSKINTKSSNIFNKSPIKLNKTCKNKDFINNMYDMKKNQSNLIRSKKKIIILPNNIDYKKKYIFKKWKIKKIKNVNKNLNKSIDALRKLIYLQKI